MAKVAKDAQTSLRLPRELHERLTIAAGDHGQGIGEEIRQRLEASFVFEAKAAPPETCRLANAITAVANNIGRFYAPWHQDPFSYEAFRVAVDVLLTYYKPGGAGVGKAVPPPAPNPKMAAARELSFGQDAPPEDPGRVLAVLAAETEGII